MSISMYEISVPVFQNMLKNLDRLLDIGSKHATETGMGESELLGARLAPNMFTLAKQVQVACDFAKNTTARLAGIEPPSMPDTETSFPELKARIAATQAFMANVKLDQIQGSDTRDITFPAGGKSLTLKGLVYLQSFAMPNFYFHYVTAYDILRHKGVELNKRQFLGWE